MKNGSEAGLKQDKTIQDDVTEVRGYQPAQQPKVVIQGPFVPRGPLKRTPTQYRPVKPFRA